MAERKRQPTGRYDRASICMSIAAVCSVSCLIGASSIAELPIVARLRPKLR